LRVSERAPNAPFPVSRPLLYCITGRERLSGPSLLESVRFVIRWGVDFVQIREKDLSDRELFRLARGAVALARNASCRVLVNGRPDIALAAGAAGVHLPSQGLGPDCVRRWLPPGFILGVSAHSLPEVRRAAAQGADYVLLGPVFETESKKGMGRPLGLARLRRACAAFPIPVLALGGIHPESVAGVLEAGAAGVAGIGMFQRDIPRSGITRGQLLRKYRQKLPSAALRNVSASLRFTDPQTFHARGCAPKAHGGCFENTDKSAPPRRRGIAEKTQ
jgi:thiamine-phosphate pyrophosphorylase